jgi:hypothetical protein
MDGYIDVIGISHQGRQVPQFSGLSLVSSNQAKNISLRLDKKVGRLDNVKNPQAINCGMD